MTRTEALEKALHIARMFGTPEQIAEYERMLEEAGGE